jgi:hypothetical protein
MKLFLLQLSLVLAMATSAMGQITTIGKTENSGQCSFTVVNPNNSTFKVSCGGKGLRPEEAKQLAQVLTIVKRNDLQFAQVLQSLETLAAQMKASAAKPTIQQNCPEGFCNAGPVEAPQTLNDNRQFGAHMPEPDVFVVGQDKPRVISRPVRTPEMSDAQYQSALSSFQMPLQGTPLADHPGLTIYVRVARNFSNPAFEVTCDKPCVATSLGAVSGQMMFSSTGADSRNKMFSSNHSNVVLFVFGNEPMLVPGQTVSMTVRSSSQEEIGSVHVKAHVE